jgi:hypothetical protein
MIKKLAMLAMAVSALVAFAAPAMAQADQLYEKGPLGEHIALKVGAEITLTSTNLKTESPLGTLTCTKVTIHGEVTENGPTTIKGKEKSTTVEGCNHTITDPTAGTVSLGGGTGSTSGTKFVVDGLCTFTGSIPFKYETNTDVVTVTGTKQLSSPCGSGTMTGTFTLETKDGTTVFIT